MKAQFTPGPWSVEHIPGLDLGASAEITVPSGNKTQIIAQIWKTDDNITRWSADLAGNANAALIAAAPDLYEMLKAIDDWWKEGDQPLSPHALITDRSETQGIAGLVRAAILKAEGGQL